MAQKAKWSYLFQYWQLLDWKPSIQWSHKCWWQWKGRYQIQAHSPSGAAHPAAEQSNQQQTTENNVQYITSLLHCIIQQMCPYNILILIFNCAQKRSNNLHGQSCIVSVTDNVGWMYRPMYRGTQSKTLCPAWWGHKNVEEMDKMWYTQLP